MTHFFPSILDLLSFWYISNVDEFKTENVRENSTFLGSMCIEKIVVQQRFQRENSTWYSDICFKSVVEIFMNKLG